MQTSFPKKHIPLIVRVLLGLLLATLKHIGRRSGRAYTTPVIAKPLGDGFVIPLPYAAGVDWCRNVLTRGTCTLIWNEHDYPMERPEILPPSVALKAFPFFSRFLYTAGGIKQSLWLHPHKEVPERVSVDATTKLEEVAKRN